MAGAVRWLEWGEEAFSRAREEDRPVLLLLVAAWCRFCRELETTTFADAEVARRVEGLYVPVRVDKDRRPDVNQRYNAGGWPTIAFLTPEGELLAGETFLAAPELLPLLDRVADYWKENRETIARSLRELVTRALGEEERRESVAGSLSPEIPRDVAEAVRGKFDPLYGGFGEGQKFVHSEALDFALIWYSRTGDARTREGLVRTLDHMAAGEIHDRVEGGLFRYAGTRDWRRPHTEKTLETNAGALRAFLEGWQVFGAEEYRRAAEGIARWMRTRLRDPATRAFFGSQDADPEYYALSLEARRRREGPEVDRTIYADANAMAVSALLKASVALDDGALREAALEAIEFVRSEMIEPGRGVYHYWDGTYHVAGLLADQAYTMRALVDVAQYTGSNRTLRAADDLARVLVAQQASPGGGFYDIRTDPRALGGLKRQNRSILENAVAAEALLRLAHFTHDESHLAVARRTLEAFTRDYKQYGYYVAGYARAVDLLFHEPLRVSIVGRRADPAMGALRAAALARYVPSRIVQDLDPEEDPDLLARAGLPVRDRATAYVSVGRVSYAEVTDPGDLPSVLAMAERDRGGREA